VHSMAVSTRGPEGTGAVAAVLGPQLRPGDVVLLTGGLATGKTTFVKAAAASMGSQATVTSPTFTLAQFYPSAQGTILHVDTYRLSGIHEYRDLGLDEYLDESIVFIEWGEKVATDFPEHLLLELQCDASVPDLRVLAFSSDSPRWWPVIAKLQAMLSDQLEPELRGES
jgi:tRNA threonylcarbamoyladenosine biosynthesis protein TsaE